MKEPQQSHIDTTLVSVANLLAQAIVARGIKLEELLNRLDIAPGEYSDPNARISVSIMQRAWKLAVELTGDECFGLDLEKVVQPAALHGLGLSMMASASLLDMFERIIRFQRFLSTILRISLNADKAHYRVVFQTSHLTNPPEPASVDGALSIFIKMCRITAGSEIRPLQLRLKRMIPSACTQRYDEVFECPVKFNQRENELIFSREVLDRPLPNANADLARINDQVVIAYLRRFDSQSLTSRVRSLIIDALPGGAANEVSLATQLHMSLRSLQRQLHNEGTNFKEILAKTRLELAKEYLINSDRQIIEIGYMLGFNEPGNFSRAFKRLTGTSPQQYRSERLN